MIYIFKLEFVSKVRLRNSKRILIVSFLIVEVYRSTPVIANGIRDYFTVFYTSKNYSLKYIDSNNFKRFNDYGFGISFNNCLKKRTFLSGSIQYSRVNYKKNTNVLTIPSTIKVDYLNFGTSCRFKFSNSHIYSQFFGISFNRAMRNLFNWNVVYKTKLTGHVDNIQLEYESLIRLRRRLFVDIVIGYNLFSTPIEINSRYKTEKFLYNLGISYVYN